LLKRGKKVGRKDLLKRGKKVGKKEIFLMKNWQ
jgi:hypothetical protein